jgi:hypothetical protein
MTFFQSFLFPPSPGCLLHFSSFLSSSSHLFLYTSFFIFLFLFLS